MNTLQKTLMLTLIPNFLINVDVFAAESSRAWGASSNITNQLHSSSNYHLAAGQNAQIIGTGSDTRSINKTSTSCGVCIYNTNTGNNNTIQGNTTTSTNTGSVTSTANFTETSLVTTNAAGNGANPAK